MQGTAHLFSKHTWARFNKSATRRGVSQPWRFEPAPLLGPKIHAVHLADPTERAAREKSSRQFGSPAITSDSACLAPSHSAVHCNTERRTSYSPQREESSSFKLPSKYNSDCGLDHGSTETIFLSALPCSATLHWLMLERATCTSPSRQLIALVSSAGGILQLGGASA
jgi:hypothetical protein